MSVGSDYDDAVYGNSAGVYSCKVITVSYAGKARCDAYYGGDGSVVSVYGAGSEDSLYSAEEYDGCVSGYAWSGSGEEYYGKCVDGGYCYEEASAKDPVAVDAVLGSP